MKKNYWVVFSLFFLWHFSEGKTRPSILVIYSVPAKIPNGNWNDGFVAAMTLLEKKYSVTWRLLGDMKQRRINYDDHDIIFIKSAWGAECELAARKLIPVGKPKALLISAMRIPPKGRDFLSYDVLFFETYWYKQFIAHHPCAIHAFGINTNIMKPSVSPVEKIYDYIMVCDFRNSSKRHNNFLDKKGVKIALGGVGDVALAYCEDENVSFSPLIKACTLSRLFDDPRSNVQDDILKSEKIIAAASDEEFAVIDKLCQRFET